MDNFDRFKVGDEFTLKHQITKSDLLTFSRLTGDNNPLHMSEEFAKKTNFQTPVVHGMLSASFISTIIGTQIPGEGALWLSQTLRFLKPTRIDDVIRVKARISHKSLSTRILSLDITISNQSEDILISGEATVKVVELRKEEPSMDNNSALGVAIVTGASRGIGAAIAKRLAKDGYKVIVNFRSSASEAQSVVDEIEALQGVAVSYKADVTDSVQVKDMFDFAADKLGPVEVLVNNASSSIVNKSFADMVWADFQSQIDVQLKGFFFLLKEAIPIFKERRFGKIISIASIYTDGSPPVKTYDYVAAKSALVSLTKSIAVEYGPAGIQANIVSPGMTMTSLIANIPEKTKLVTEMNTPLRRLANPSDIASAVSFLSSRANTYITGETIRVCGGQVMI